MAATPEATQLRGDLVPSAVIHSEARYETILRNFPVTSWLIRSSSQKPPLPATMLSVTAKVNNTGNDYNDYCSSRFIYVAGNWHDVSQNTTMITKHALQTLYDYKILKPEDEPKPIDAAMLMALIAYTKHDVDKLVMPVQTALEDEQEDQTEPASRASFFR